MKPLSQIHITEEDHKQYPLPETKDIEILKLCKYLEQYPLKEEDEILIRFIRTQLLDNWRDPLLDELNKIKDKYESGTV